MRRHIRPAVVVGLFLFGAAAPPPLDTIADLAFYLAVVYAAGRFLWRSPLPWRTRSGDATATRSAAPSSQDLRTVGRPMDVLAAIRNVTALVAMVMLLPVILTEAQAQAQTAHIRVMLCPGHECELSGRKANR